MRGREQLLNKTQQIEVRCFTGLEDLDGLRETWQALMDGASGVSVFQTHLWQRIWWKHYGSGSPYILMAYAGAEPVAILPLYRSTEGLPLMRPLRTIRPIGVGGDTSPDYLGQIALDAHARDTAAAFVEYLFTHRSDWDVLELTDLAENSALLEQLRERRPLPGWHTEPYDLNRISYTELPANWDAYLAALTSHARYSVRNIRRKLLAIEGSRLFQWADPGQLDSAVDQLIQLHTQRWEGRAEHHSFSSAKYNAFHRELMHEFLRCGWLRLYCVELSSKLIGVFYGYAFRKTLYHFQGGFDPAHEKLRVGQCVMAFAIECAIGEGCTVLDMLRGEYEYKKRWAPETRQTISYRITRPTLPAYLSKAMRRVILPTTSRGRNVLRRLMAGGDR